MKLSTFLLLLCAIFILQDRAFGGEYTSEECSAIVKRWEGHAISQLSELSEDRHTELKELLYFLHVPRTGGRTFHQCLLRNLYPREQLCNHSYDKLRFNAKSHCRLLVSHDDYSILSTLPVRSISIVTNLRHPVDRVFSAYEFTVEVAARFLRPALRSKVDALKASKMASSTLMIWPWSIFVPWMRDDLYERGKHRISSAQEKTSPEGFSNYNASAFVMPFHEFIHQHLVTDNIHNGEAFQIAGLTSNSYTKGAEKIRRCIVHHPHLGAHVLNVAKMRLDKMIFVGLTEKHEDSAKAFAHIVAKQIHAREEPIISTTQRSPSAVSELRNSASDNATGFAKQALTVDGLIRAYEKCSGRLRSIQAEHRIVSLKHSLPISFSEEARLGVPEQILEEIKKLSALDLDLFEYVQHRFKQQSSVYNSSQNNISQQHATRNLTTEINIIKGQNMINEGLQRGFGYTKLVLISVLYLMAIGVVVSIGKFVLSARRPAR
ncbi:hypothetical protein KP509_20G011700 [Ceratopteris richardii]|uniref:Sulfotransferase n=1 Tax=Ceratopteris richardii TaxID=49495 RepID=A0A8T2SEP1_CERRI|nr:hypothetical protein KP509_20G011700 [Ceratopteris richardii]